MEKSQNNLGKLEVEEQYIINENTIAIFPYYSDNGELNSTILEKHKVLQVAKSPKDIVNESCIFYGSDMDGRIASALSIIKRKRVLPIMISETHKLCMVPLCSSQLPKCIWVAYQHVKDIISERDHAIIVFTNHKMAKVEITRKTMERKLEIASRLVSTYDFRNEQLADTYKQEQIAEESEIYSIDSNKFKKK